MNKAPRITATLFLILLFVLANACKEKEPTVPIISTFPVIAVSSTTASSGGEITDKGGSDITSRGVCWNTSPDPTIANYKTSDGKGIGIFFSSMTGLDPNTIYFVRAYATNSTGTIYGNTFNFRTHSQGK